MQRQNASSYSTLMASATGVLASKLGIIESIMRNEIFRSTLDWQTADQLAAAALQTHDTCRSAPCLSDMAGSHRKTVYNLSRFESRLARGQSSGKLPKIQDLESRVSFAQLSEQSAYDALPRLAAFHELDPA